jgi:predicted DNA-binding transcriptional regulator AlpA
MPEELDEIRLLDLGQVAAAVGRSKETVKEWVRLKIFPPPMQAYPGAKQQWTFPVVRAWIEQRRRARYRPRSPRGALMRGRELKPQRDQR